MDLDAAYRLLGVDRATPLEQARACFRARAKSLHPDHGGATAATAELIDAWRLVEADLRHLPPPAAPSSAPPSSAPPRATRLRRPAEHECEVCGTNPAANLTLRRVVGLLVVSPVVQARARVCRGCARAAGAEWQALTLLRGWWSIFGPVVTPFVFLTNVVALRSHRRHTAGRQRRDPFLDVPEGGPLPHRAVLARPAVLAVLLGVALAAAAITLLAIR